jgi:hypothetical protein
VAVSSSDDDLVYQLEAASMLAQVCFRPSKPVSRPEAPRAAPEPQEDPPVMTFGLVMLACGAFTFGVVADHFAVSVWRRWR